MIGVPMIKFCSIIVNLSYRFACFKNLIGAVDYCAKGQASQDMFFCEDSPNDF